MTIVQCINYNTIIFFLYKHNHVKLGDQCWDEFIGMLNRKQIVKTL